MSVGIIQRKWYEYIYDKAETKLTIMINITHWPWSNPIKQEKRTVKYPALINQTFAYLNAKNWLLN